MSASPATMPARQRPKASIFAPKKKPIPKRQALPAANRAQAANGAASGQNAQGNGTTTTAQAPPEEEGEWQEFPIFVSKDTLTRNLHYHAMKLAGRTWKNDGWAPIDPYDESQFQRPLQLHRRSARDKITQPEQQDAPGIDDKERELMSIRREERQREREEAQAQIAPTGGDSSKPRRQKPRKKVEDVWFDEKNEDKTRKQKIKYEESRPWHLEDADHKNIWWGQYQEPPSDQSVLFEINDTGGFRMVPVERWYTFQEASRPATNVTLEGDAAEKEFAKTGKVPRFLRNTEGYKADQRRQQALQRTAAIKAEQRGGDEVERMPEVKDEYNADVDEVDFEYDDEFQDDDEGAMFGDQEADEAKDIEKRIREEMRNAGLGATGIKDEDKDYDAEEAKQREAERAERRQNKRLRKALQKKERKNEYDDDSDHGEFSESSESEDSEEERERLEQERKQEEARKADGDKSGASTRGTNTPSGRPEKKDPARLGNSLKRPGSPDLSELSGNESSRKRHKVNGTAATNGARALSPRSSRPPRSNTGGSGSGSETEASTREGRGKVRIRNSPPTSPNGSRPATPSGSRAQSPQRNKRPPFPTLEEVRAAIPADGIGIGELVNLFRLRVMGRQNEFIPLVKQAGRQDPSSKKILPKTAAEMQQQQQGS